MSSLAVVYPKEIGATPRELLELVSLPSEAEHSIKQLSGSANELVRTVVSIVDSMVLRAMDQRTAESFSTTRAEVFPQYFAAMSALGTLLRVVVPKKDIAWISAQSLSELEADFRDNGAAAFGLELRDRGIFTVWVLRKITDLAEELEEHPVSTDRSRENGDKVKQFAVSAIWARFHIDCLVKSMQSHKPIFPEVVEHITDGLRAAVNAYAWLRQEVDERSGISEPELPAVHWDEEDDVLLADSMRDLSREAD
jgi:hypothetical protein